MTGLRSIKNTKKSFDNGHWQFEDQLDYNNAAGFVYVIKDKLNGMMYIGKKFFRGAGKYNKGQQSNWRSYTSSSKSLQARMDEVGQDQFEFIIVEQYYTKGGLSWAETWSQVVVEVPSNNHIWYNRFIDKVMWKVTEPVTVRHKYKLKELCLS
jgi:hypothetical protein